MHTHTVSVIFYLAAQLAEPKTDGISFRFPRSHLFLIISGNVYSMFSMSTILAFPDLFDLPCILVSHILLSILYHGGALELLHDLGLG